MRRVLFLVAMAVEFSAQMTEISGDRMRAHVKFLSSDLLEGRGVGSRGGDLASDYIATQFALIGAKPLGDAGTYFQQVALVGVAPQPSSQLAMAPSRGARLRFPFQWLHHSSA